MYTNFGARSSAAKNGPSRSCTESESVNRRGTDAHMAGARSTGLMGLEDVGLEPFEGYEPIGRPLRSNA